MVAVTTRADPNYDIVFLLDLDQRRLHCFVPNRDRSGSFTYGGSRDLGAARGLAVGDRLSTAEE